MDNISSPGTPETLHSAAKHIIVHEGWQILDQLTGEKNFK